MTRLPDPPSEPQHPYIDQHQLDMLAASGIPPEHAYARGYETISDPLRLHNLGFVKEVCAKHADGLLIPQLRINGTVWGHLYRPDSPRSRDGKPLKYEAPWRQSNHLDFPPGIQDRVNDPRYPIVFTEGTKKADAGAIWGLCAISLNGVWGFMGTNETTGLKTTLVDFRDIGLNNGREVWLAFDSDVAVNPKAAQGLCEFADFLKLRGAAVSYVHFPHNGVKLGLDDFLVSGGTVEELRRLVKPTQPLIQDDYVAPPPPPKHAPAQPVPLSSELDVFGKWLYIKDSAPIIVVAATVVANLADGDPVWLLLVEPPSCGKTEILISTMGLEYIVPAATITEASLLSGTPPRDRARGATGGLMRQIGAAGILLCKDFTSVLSQNKDTAKAAVAALREIYDGRWDRPIGSAGAKVMHWDGKCGFLGGVTPSYDRFSVVTAGLGDRFLLLRMPTPKADAQASAALNAAQQETVMRAELAEAMCGLINGADLDRVCASLRDDEEHRLKTLAIFAARARTVVERDGYTGDLLAMPGTEGPARPLKQMRQLYGGLAAVGADENARWRILRRVALSCPPAIRLPLLRQLVSDGEQWQSTAAVAEAAGLVTRTATRHLDDLTLLKLAERTKHPPEDRTGVTVKGGPRADGSDTRPNWWRASGWLRSNWPDPIGEVADE